MEDPPYAPFKQGYDELNYRSDAILAQFLSPDEEILLSKLVYKYNSKNKEQERSLLITSKAIYNLHKEDLLATTLTLFDSSYQIRRRIDLRKLSAVSVSNSSSEFVLHVPEEYDYRYASPEKRDQILTVLCRAYFLIHQQPLPFYSTSDMNLMNYTTTEDDKKNKISRIPTEDSLEEKFGLNIQDPFYSILYSTLDDFEILEVSEKSAFAEVMLVEMKKTKQVYVIKSFDKEKIIEGGQIESFKTERFILEKSKFPFLAQLVHAFQTPEKVFFVMTFMRGGELFQHLQANKRFEEKIAKFYAAEIVLGIEYIHALGVVHRYIKPENVLMDDEGHVCLTGFDIAKQIKEGELTKSFVGTLEFVAPELLAGNGYSKPVDWWALGTVIFEIIIGEIPFFNKDRDCKQMINSIKEKEVNFGTEIEISPEAKDLIIHLLKKDPSQRLGAHGAQEIKDHPWFSDINWNQLAEKKIAPPFKPQNLDKKVRRKDLYTQKYIIDNTS